MHPALTVLEIISLILSSGINRKTMLNVALTCRLWKDPGLDQLWRDLDSVFPLIYVLVPLRVGSRDARTLWVS